MLKSPLLPSTSTTQSLATCRHKGMQFFRQLGACNKSMQNVYSFAEFNGTFPRLNYGVRRVRAACIL